MVRLCVGVYACRSAHYAINNLLVIECFINGQINKPKSKLHTHTLLHDGITHTLIHINNMWNRTDETKFAKMWTLSHSHTLPDVCVRARARTFGSCAHTECEVKHSARTVNNLRGRSAPWLSQIQWNSIQKNRLYMYLNLNLNGNGNGIGVEKTRKASSIHTRSHTHNRVYNAYHLGRVHWLGKEHGWRNSKRSFYCNRFEATAAASTVVLWLWHYSAAGVINIRYSFYWLCCNVR